MKTFEQLKQQAVAIRDAVNKNENSAERVGAHLLDTVEKMESLEITDVAEAVLEAEAAAAEAKKQADIASQSGEIAQKAKEQGDIAEQKGNEADAAAQRANEAADQVTNKVLFKIPQDLSEEEQAQVKRNIGLQNAIAGLITLPITDFSAKVNATTATKTVDNIIPSGISFLIVDIGVVEGDSSTPTSPELSAVLCPVSGGGRIVFQGTASTKFENFKISVISGSAEKDGMGVEVSTPRSITYKVFQVRYLTEADSASFKGSFNSSGILQSAYPTARPGDYAYVGNPRHLYEWDSSAWQDRGLYITDVDQALDIDSGKAIANKAVTAKLSKLDAKSVPLLTGYYIDTKGRPQEYKLSQLSCFLTIPKKNCNIKNIWNHKDVGLGIIFFDKDGKYISGYDLGEEGNALKFTWNVETMEKPEGAFYFVVQTQSNSVIIESSENLTTGIPYNVATSLLNNSDSVSILEKKAIDYDTLYSQEDIVTEIGIAGKYIDFNSGKPTVWDLYNISKAIPVNAGDTIMAVLSSNTGVTAISECNEELTEFKPLIKGNGITHASLHLARCSKDGFVCFSYEKSNGVKDARKLSAYASKEAINALQKSKDNEIAIQNKAEYSEETGKNLFNKDGEFIEGKYINSLNGALNSFENCSVSPLIPVTPGKVYHLHRDTTVATNEARFVKSDGTTALIPLKATGEPFDNYMLGKPDMAVKAPEEAAYFQFTTKFKGTECGETTQFEVGNTFTGFEEYHMRKIVPYVHLPKELEGLSNKVVSNTQELSLVKNRVDKLEENTGLGAAVLITIANSDKIGFFSNSFLNGYCMLGKHAINNLSMFSDYIMYNYGHSGDDMLECLNRVDKNEKWLGDVSVKEWGIKYGVIAMQDNDGALFNASSDTYYWNTKHLAEAVKSLGAIPILGTEHDTSYYYAMLANLAQEEGYMFMPWGKKASSFNAGYGLFKPFWYNSHPATRTGWLWTYGMKPYLDTLPRPRKSIKIFRVRPGIETEELENLMYNSVEQRAELYEELTCGVSSYKEDKDKYFDRLDAVTLSELNQTYKDEYQTLQAKTGSVSLGNYALIEVVTPFDAHNLKKATLFLTGNNIQSVYIRKIIGLEKPLPANDGKIAFGVESGIENFTIGKTFNITGGQLQNPTDIQGTYKVSAIINNVVVTETSSKGKETSGTDVPQSDVEGASLKGSYSYPSGDYLNRYNKPYGEWLKIESENLSVINIDEYLSGCVDFDKIAFLLVGSDMSITDLHCEVEGLSEKKDVCKPLIVPKKGTSLLSKNLLTDEDATEWTGLEYIPKYNPVQSTKDESKESLPTGITVVREFSEGQSIMQQIKTSSITNSPYSFPKLQVRIVARYFPKYINSDEVWDSTELHRGTFDCAKIKIKIAKTQDDKNPVILGEILVGAWWNEFLLNNYKWYDESYLIVECSSKKVQIAGIYLEEVE